MADTIFPGTEPQTEAEYEMVFAQITAELGRLNQLMREDDIEIARLKAETQRFKEESDRCRTQARQIKAASKELDAEISAALKRLKGAMPC